MLPGEGEQLLVARVGGRQSQFCQPAAEPSEQNSDMLVYGVVDADDDIVAPQLHAGPDNVSPLQIRVAGRWSGGRTGLR